MGLSSTGFFCELVTVVEGTGCVAQTHCAVPVSKTNSVTIYMNTGARFCRPLKILLEYSMRVKDMRGSAHPLMLTSSEVSGNANW